MLTKDNKMIKEENKKLKHDMNEKEILTNGPTGKFNKERGKQMWQTETQKTQKHPSQQNRTLETRNRFAPPQKTKDEVLDKEKDIPQHHQQISVYNKHDHQTIFQKIIIPFHSKKQHL